MMNTPKPPSFLLRLFQQVGELVVIFLFIFTINNYLGREQILIKADGKGYYDYLPATFIYHDLNFNYLDTLQYDLYPKDITHLYILTKGDARYNKYFPGTAILMTPFFLGGHAAAKIKGVNTDGYGSVYQESIFYAALFYLWLGLLYLRKLLLKFRIKRWIIFFTQLLLVLATPIVHYAYADAAFSHVYSFTLITLFVYHSYGALKEGRKHAIIYSAILFGLLVLVRPVNLIILGIIPFYFKSFDAFKTSVKETYENYRKQLLLGIIALGVVLAVLPILWLIQTGQPVFWPYAGEGFDFLHPHFTEFLFSYQNGMFLYTPLLFIAFTGAFIVLLIRKQYYRIFGVSAFFCLVIYVMSSWHVWFYGESFGSRTFIEYYFMAGVALALLLQYASTIGLRILILTLCTLCIPLNNIQAFQYEQRILHGAAMDSNSYWEIFLKTDPLYEWILYREPIFYSAEQVLETKNYNEQIWLTRGDKWTVFDSLIVGPEVEALSWSAFWCADTGRTNVIVAADNPDRENILWYQRRSLHLARHPFSCNTDSIQVRLPKHDRPLHVKLMAHGENDRLITTKMEVRLLNFTMKDQ